VDDGGDAVLSDSENGVAVPGGVAAKGLGLD